MTGSPRVSAITIFFNEEQFLEEAIESVFAQTCTVWELLLVDDGSTDGSPEIARRYAVRDPGRVRLFEHKGRANLGMSASRNLGIREACGDYIAFLDGDDVWLPEELERQLADLERAPAASMVYGPVHYWFGWTGLPEDRRRDFIPDLGVEAGTLVRPPGLLAICHPLGKAPAAATCGFLIRKGALDDVGGFEDAFRDYGEDMVFFSKTALRHTVLVSGECLARYRMHPGSCCFTVMRTGRHGETTRVVLSWLKSYLKQQGVTHPEIWRELAAREASDQVAQVPGTVGDTGLDKAEEPWIQADPNPIVATGRFSDRFAVGETTLSWRVANMHEAEVRVGAPDGPLLSRTAGPGKTKTGKWVHDGMTFYLQNVTGGLPPTSDHTLAVTMVRVTVQPKEPDPPVGQVRFGDLRRVTPISEEWGFDRGLPIDRYYIERFLTRHSGDVRGRVLEVGDDSYTRRFGSARVIRSDVLNVLEGMPGTTIVGDLACAPHIPSEAFDCIILTQTLQCIFDTGAAVRTLCRILRSGGVLLATFPGISHTCDRHWGDSWFWNFTPRSAARLFSEEFGDAGVKVESYGNVLAAVAFLHGLASDELRIEELDRHDPGYDLTVAVRAVKGGSRATDRYANRSA